MKGDFSRNTFRPAKHYSGVRMQQGRVQLDADWNEQIDIQSHLDETTEADVIGRAGGPLEAGTPVNETGFALYLQGGLPWVRHGRYYVDGILCENEADTPVLAQEDLPGLTLPGENGTYLFYLDVWRRHLTALEEPSLREVALGGPDTATRTRTVWQVKWLRVTGADLTKACEAFGTPAWTPAPLTSTGQLAARAQPEEGSADPCVVPAGAGYRRLENQLYRVEVHDAGSADGAATFKWSRDNGVLASRVKSVDTALRLITVDAPGKDAYRRFMPNQWIELTDEGRVLRGEPGVLLQIDSVTGPRLTVKTWPVGTPSTGALTVRAWDTVSSNGVLKVATDATPATPATKDWITLESGIQVLFKPGTYRTGDYWLIPARTVLGDVEWPRDGANNPRFEARHGTEHHYCALAMLERTGGAEPVWSVMHDCRRLFPPLTQLKALLYAGGDGQEAMPGQWLARPLRAGVFNGQVPVAGASVRFTVLTGEGNGVLATEPGAGATAAALTVTTGANGIAEVYWRPDDTGWTTDSIRYSQRVEARLLDQDGSEMHGPIRYGASLSVASHVAYHHGCANLSEAKTVQEALDTLCNQLELSYEGGDGQEVLPGRALDQPLRVGVARHQLPVGGQTVRFTTTTGQLSLDGVTYSAQEVVATTGATGDLLGIAQVYWRPDGNVEAPATQQVRARLELEGQPVHLPLVFTARLSLARLVGYTPGCDNLGGAQTVQEALDTLCNQLELSYVGGDAQEAMPGEPLPLPLRVGVARHQRPVGGATVRFTAESGELSLNNDTGWDKEVVATTELDGTLLGVAQVYWRPDGNIEAPDTQEVVARLEVGTKVVHLPVRFTAHLSRARAVAYQPGACSTLAGASTVQEALDTLCSVRSFRYVGGDGQQAPRGQLLPSPLEVAVVSGETPVSWALVRFRITTGNAGDALLRRGDDPKQAGMVLDVPTDAAGVARVSWKLDAQNPTQRVEAVLLDSAGQPSAVPPLHFTARIAENAGDDGSLRITEIAWANPQIAQLVNNGAYTFWREMFSPGIRLTCSDRLQVHDSLPPFVVSMQVDVPYPFTTTDLTYWRDTWSRFGMGNMPGFIGYQTFTLIGTARTDGNILLWMPAPVTTNWLNALTGIAYTNGVRVRLVVKGGFIRSADGTRLLDGEVISQSSTNPFGIGLPNAGDGRRGGDFELFFTLFPSIIGVGPITGGPGGVVTLPHTTLPGTPPLAGPASGLLAAGPTASKPRTFTGLKQAWGMARDLKRAELLVADTAANALVRFDLKAEEGAKPLVTAGEGLEAPSALVLDAERDEVFVANSGGDSVSVFRRDAKGHLVPARTLSGRKTGLSGPVGLALDPRHQALFVAGSGRTLLGPTTGARAVKAAFLCVFDVDASGDVAPRRRWTGEQLELSRAAGLTVDVERRELFVADAGADAVAVFSLDALLSDEAGVKPLRVLKGKRTALGQPVALSLDAQGQELWVANARSGEVTVYARDAQGDVAPVRTVEVPGEPGKGLRGVLA
ncbi:hypothetical protein D7Y23_18395 [Corallococcus sp. AB050B]|nr:hypothetical protein D7Y23_18395 [Corallococcus sp. AB050B]